MFHFAVGPILRITYEGWAKPCITEMCKSPYVNQEAHTGVGGGGGIMQGTRVCLFLLDNHWTFSTMQKAHPAISENVLSTE